jgi:hypothetical protein
MFFLIALMGWDTGETRRIESMDFSWCRFDTCVDWLIDWWYSQLSMRSRVHFSWLNLIVFFFFSSLQARRRRRGRPARALARARALAVARRGPAQWAAARVSGGHFGFFPSFSQLVFSVLGILGAFRQDRADRCGGRMGWHQYLIV